MLSFVVNANILSNSFLLDEDDEEEEVFEVTAYHHCRMTVLFEHPAKDGMACGMLQL